MEIDLRDLERRLRQPIPSIYAEYVRKTKPLVLTERGFDPKTLCVLNLELRSGDRDGCTMNRFFLSSDGCGNYYFVLAEQSATKVFLWAHDPPGVEDPRIDLNQFLKTAEQYYRILEIVDNDRICIAKTIPFGESILNPITLDEWKSAIERCDGIGYVGYVDWMNPFTGESKRIEVPGEAVSEFGNERRRFRLTCGRIVGEYSPLTVPIARTLSSFLNAKLYM